jgi:cytochrome c oxidase accessory protein FixG
MCPWPRLQGAIWDPEAFTVNYRDYRGEQRMSAKKAAELRLQGKPAGDCVDCNQCVTVCPIGIDIREGPNFACINCGLCVDACDSVMSKLGRRRGLIDYESWDNIERGHRAEPRVSRLVRPKTVGLTAVCLVLTAAIVFSFMTRTSASLSVQHDRDPLAVRLSDGSVRNAYTVKLLNKSSATHAYTLSVSGVDARMAIIGYESLAPIEVPADGSEAVRVTLTAMNPREAELVFTARARAEPRFSPQKTGSSNVEAPPGRRQFAPIVASLRLIKVRNAGICDIAQANAVSSEVSHVLPVQQNHARRHRLGGVLRFLTGSRA